jgi:hypothetical protein
MVVAFMAQHIWEIGASVLAVVIAGQGVFLLVAGRDAARALGISERTRRPTAVAFMALGVGIGVAAFTVQAEQPGAPHGNGWGGPVGIVFLCVWVMLMCAVPVSRLVKARSMRRRSGTRDGCN